MEAIIDVLLGFLWEVGGNLLFQVLVEVGLRSLVEPFRRSDRRNPLLAYIGCILLRYLGVLIFTAAPLQDVAVFAS